MTIINNQLTKYLEVNKLLSDNNRDRKKRSTDDLNIYLSEKWNKASQFLDKTAFVGFDIAKAFDRVLNGSPLFMAFASMNKRFVVSSVIPSRFNMAGFLRYLTSTLYLVDLRDT